MKANARRRLGSSDVHVSALGLGGAALGNLYAPVDEEAARATVRRALERGVAYFDTAPYYGYGLSEERLGRALVGTARGAFTISTKVGRRLVPRSGPARSDQGFVRARAFDPVFDYSYDGVLRSFESSLERLQLDRVDILLVHDLGAMTHGDERHREVFDLAMEGGYRALSALRDSGVVGAVGLGVNESQVCVEALERADFDCFLLAGRYTLLEQGALDRLLPLCEKRRVSIIVGGPFNSGILVEGEAGARHYDYATADAEILDRVRRIGRLCEAYDVPLPAAALQFPLLHPAVAAVIPGARTPVEIEANAAWLEIEIPRALYRDLQGAGLLRPDAPIGAAG
ncbi:MAG: aldo/keto reductase [Myxococcota bacterium]